MIQRQDFLTTASDFQIIVKSLKQSLLKLPRLIFLNALFMLLFILIKGFYSYKFIFKHENEFLTTLSNFNFSVLQFGFLIFLVPFQLHHGDKFPIKEFSAFLKRTVWPVVIESCKALFYLAGYFFLCGILTGLALGGLSLFIDISIFDTEALEGGELNPQLILISLLVFLICSPLWIRSIQYNFIPFVIFFNEDYQAIKKEVLQKSILVSRGCALLIIPVFFVLPRIVEFIKSILLYPISTSETTLAHVTSFTIESILGLILVIYFCIFFYFIYHSKKSQ